MIRQRVENQTSRMRKFNAIRYTLYARPDSRSGGYAGFTLVETLVAIGVLMAAVAGTLTVASRGIALTGVSRDNIVAFYLAQEPIEFIRKYRDTTAIACITANTCSLPGFDWLRDSGAPGTEMGDLSECV